MNDLLQIGFEVSGDWRLDGGRLRISFHRHASQKNVLYAFVCDGELKYVGKSVQTLRGRMANYISPGADSKTNLRVRQLISEQLAAGVAVQVYALPDSGLMHYGPFHLNLAAGLEDSIINMLDPAWNMTAGKRKAVPSNAAEAGGEAPSEPDAIDPERAAPPACYPLVDTPVTGTFEFLLQPTYWKNGFFNGGIASSPYLGAHGDTIEIFFKDEETPMLGSINRTVTGNNSPRVFGGPALRQRFQTLPPQTPMKVEVLSPSSIRIFEANDSAR